MLNDRSTSSSTSSSARLAQQIIAGSAVGSCPSRVSPIHRIFASLCRSLRSTSHPRSQPCRRAPLEVESCEDRTLLNVAFYQPWYRSDPHLLTVPNIQHVQVVTVYYGSQWVTDPTLRDQATMLNTYFRYLTRSSYIDLLVPYSVPGKSIGPGMWLTQDIVNIPVGGTLTIGAIENRLLADLAHRRIPPPTRNTLYFVFTPPGTQVNYTYYDNNDNPVTKAVPFRYTGQIATTYVPSIQSYSPNLFAVLPYPTAPNDTLAGKSFTVNPRNPAPGGTPVNTFQQLTALASAELADDVTFGWTTPAGKGIAELAFESPSDGTNPYYFLDNYLVQQLWSNQANSGHGGAVSPAGATTTGSTLSTLTGPTLLGPIGNSGNNPAFTWTAVPGADRYELIVTDTTTGKTVLDIATLTQPSYGPAPQAFVSGHAYRWMVRAFSNDGVMGDFASPATFTTTPVTASLPFADAYAGYQLSPSWIVRSGGFATESQHAIGLNASQLNLAVLAGVNVANVVVQANVSFSAAHQSAGLVARYSATTTANMYLAVVTALGNGKLNAAIYRQRAGIWTRIGTTTTFAGVGGALAFQLTGSSLKLFRNGVLVALATDVTLKSGSVGMRLSAGAAVTDFQTQ